MTDAPCSANNVAISRPNPEVDPVTIATSSRMRSVISLLPPVAGEPRRRATRRAGSCEVQLGCVRVEDLRAFLGGNLREQFVEDHATARERRLRVGVVGSPHQIAHAYDIAQAQAE